MAVAISNQLADMLCEAASTALDSGTIRIYTGSAPATCNDAETGTLLDELSLAANAFGVPVNGVMNANTINPSTWSASGTAGYFRAYAAGSPTGALIQGSVSESGGGGDMIISTVNAVSGGVFTINSWVWTQNKS